MEWIEISKSELDEVDRKIAAADKIGAIKALRECFRLQPLPGEGIGWCSLGLREAKEAVEFRWGTNNNPCAKIRLKGGIRVSSMTLECSAGLILIGSDGGVTLPTGTCSIEDMRKIIEIWDSIPK